MLTRARLVATLAGWWLGALAVCTLAPLIGLEDGSLALLDLREVARGLAGGGNLASEIFIDVRLPRVLAGALVGAALAAAGCAFQTALRNPLAEPFTLGISSASSFAAVLAIRWGLHTTPLGSSAVGLAALAGAAVAVYAVWRLARVGSSLPPAALLLAGVTVAFLCSAGSLAVQSTASFSDNYKIVRWMMGGLEWMRYGPVAHAAVPIAIGLGALLALARDLNALGAGPEAAASVGVDPRRAITIAFVAGSLIVGAGISIAGPIGFVGVLVPHSLRVLVGPDHRVLLPAAMAAGAALLVACDVVARTIMNPHQLPVGVVTAILGGLFFLRLLVREKGRGRLWGTW